ncbi:MAG: aminotransferase class IV [archaeon]|nr:aminotransferase class IV [archaeon]MDA1167684.1 aminotransferase class IV [archaeon]
MALAEMQPVDAVFTTCVWDGCGNLLDGRLHFNRMNHHADRLGIQLPSSLESEVFKQLQPHLKNESQPQRPSELLKIEVHADGNVKISTRTLPPYQAYLRAMSIAAPRWSGAITGCKHGAWRPYLEARDIANQHQLDIALFMHENNVVDADRATPCLISEDGVLWISSQQFGGVASITFEAIQKELEQHGFAIQFGCLTERMIRSCRELFVCGTGVGFAQIIEIDSIPIGSSQSITNEIHQLYIQHQNNKVSWSSLE